MWGLIIAGAISLGSAIYKSIQAGKQRKKMQEEADKVGVYEENPLAKQALGYAQSLYGGRMAGATAAEQSIYANQANTMASVERNATDSSQVLAQAGAAQERSNMAVNQLGELEARDRANRLSLLQNAQGLMINEGDKVRQDQLRKMYQNMAIYGVYSKNQTDAVSEMASGASMIGYGVEGGISNVQSGKKFGYTDPSVYSGSVWSNGIKNPYIKN